MIDDPAYPFDLQPVFGEIFPNMDKENNLRVVSKCLWEKDSYFKALLDHYTSAAAALKRADPDLSWKPIITLRQNLDFFLLKQEY